MRERAMGRQKQLTNNPARFCRRYRRLRERSARGEKVKQINKSKRKVRLLKKMRCSYKDLRDGIRQQI